MKLQKFFIKFLSNNKNTFRTEEDLIFRRKISQIVGCEIVNSHIYKEAFTLKEPGVKNSPSYERLEFLGDAILGSIISCYLFNAYPGKREGFLTQMKSKIVSRNNLNKIGEELGLPDLAEQKAGVNAGGNLAGNLFEALIGAIYLDLGYEVCEKTVLGRLLTPQEIAKLENKIMSYKSLLLEWAQKNKLELTYETTEEHLPNKILNFKSVIRIGSEKISNASDSSKKKAEEKAAQRAFYSLNKKENILEKSTISIG